MMIALDFCAVFAVASNVAHFVAFVCAIAVCVISFLHNWCASLVSEQQRLPAAAQRIVRSRSVDRCMHCANAHLATPPPPPSLRLLTAARRGSVHPSSRCSLSPSLAWRTPSPSRFKLLFSPCGSSAPVVSSTTVDTATTSRITVRSPWWASTPFASRPTRRASRCASARAARGAITAAQSASDPPPRHFEGGVDCRVPRSEGVCCHAAPHPWTRRVQGYTFLMMSTLFQTQEFFVCLHDFFCLQRDYDAVH